MRKTDRFVIGTLILGICITLIGGAILVKELRDVASENRGVTCATADLVAHVPAVQFEGESFENFIGWIRARRDVLAAAQAAQTCEPEIVTALEKRIHADEVLVEQLKE